MKILNKLSANKQKILKQKEKEHSQKKEIIKKITEIQQYITLKEKNETLTPTKLENKNLNQLKKILEIALKKAEELKYAQDIQQEITEETNKKLEALFIKQREFLISRKKLVKHEQPIVILMRITGEDEIIEGVKGSEFKFIHSNGKEMKIPLGTLKLRKLPYGKDTLSYYIIYEDSFFPLPNEPIYETTTINQLFDKTIHDSRKLSESISITREKAKAWAKILGMIILGMLAIGLVYMMAPGLFDKIFGDSAQKGAEIATEVLTTNTTNIAGV